MLPRRFRTRVLAAFTIIGTCSIISVYYVPDTHILEKVALPERTRLWTLLWSIPDKRPIRIQESSSADFNTADIYPKLDFSVPDNGGMGFWNDVLESRYREIRKNWKNLPLKVSEAFSFVLILIYYNSGLFYSMEQTTQKQSPPFCKWNARFAENTKSLINLVDSKFYLMLDHRQ